MVHSFFNFDKFDEICRRHINIFLSFLTAISKYDKNLKHIIKAYALRIEYFENRLTSCVENKHFQIIS